MVLHTARAFEPPVRQSPVEELDRPRSRPRCRRQEDEQEFEELP